MATFRKIHVSFWKDPFVRKLTPEQKYFYLYLMTNPQTKQCGIYEIDLGTISHETGYNLETVGKLIKFFETEGKIKYSAAKDEIAIKNWLKYNDNISPKVKKLVDKELEQVKDTVLIQYVYSMDTTSTIRRRIEEEQEREEEAQKPSEIGSEKVRDVANEVWKDQIWREQLCMGMYITADDLKNWMALFNSSVANDSVDDFDVGKYKKMIRGWISKQIANGHKLPPKPVNEKSQLRTLS